MQTLSTWRLETLRLQTWNIKVANLEFLEPWDAWTR